ncbi:MAG: efflux RND transporter periplasmic adaptor subunit [Proteobacteria bacterium]|nr:efflux RND transporter periplasmic adaptor subunit [Pseudomonadota bacterium]NIS71927.1 efflux RND transporter periplasmic adaptor subunit [Pseudomonadota bacterium]
MKRRITFLSISFVLVLVLPLVLSGCGEKGAAEKPPPEKVTHVVVIPVVPSLVKDQIILPGSIEPWEDIEISAEVPGKIEWIGPLEGENVRKGDVLVKIDSQALQAEVEKADALYRLKDNQLERRRMLSRKGFLPKEELDMAIAERDSTLKSLEVARIQLAKGTIRSPITGLVNLTYVDAGEYVSVGDPILDLVEMDRVKIVGAVPEMDVPFVSISKIVRVTLDALGNEAFQGKIIYLSPKGDNITRTFTLKVALDNPTFRIKPGMIGRITIVKRTFPNAIAIPLFSIVDRGDRKIVFVEDQGVARERIVALGVIENSRIQILTGLSPGDHLIVKGHRDLSDGDKVLAQEAVR